MNGPGGREGGERPTTSGGGWDQYYYQPPPPLPHHHHQQPYGSYAPQGYGQVQGPPQPGPYHDPRYWQGHQPPPQLYSTQHQIGPYGYPATAQAQAYQGWAGQNPGQGWEHHPVAPQQYCQRQADRRPRQQNPRRDVGRKGPSKCPPASPSKGGQGPAAEKTAAAPAPPQNLECLACQRTFKHPSQLQAHLSMHQICGYKGCTFSAIPKVLKEHREEVHVKGSEKSKASAVVSATASAETEEEIRAYLAERRANYPTGENLRLKREREETRQTLGQLDPDGEKGKRMKRLREVLQAQKRLGVAKMAGTDKIGKDLVVGSGKEKAKGEAVSLVPYSSDSESEGGAGGGGKGKFAKGQKKKEAKRLGKERPGPRGRKDQNQGKRQRKPEESLVSKLLSKNIRKEKSHVLQCLRFLVKTKFKMAFS